MAHEKDHEYAHEMFYECVRGDQGNLQYVEAMLQNLRARYSDNKKNSRHLLPLSGTKDFRKALSHQSWADVLSLGIRLLERDPWNVATLHGLARACEALHYNEVELAYLKQAMDAAPKDADVNRHCAKSLARMGQFDQAIACWHRVEEIHRNDREAAEMISRLAEERMKYPGGKPPAGAKSLGQATGIEEQTTKEIRETQGMQVPPEIPLTPRERLERAIEEDPADVSNYLKLSELLCEMEHFENAERTLMRAMEYCAQRQLIEDKLATVRAQRNATESKAAELQRQKELRAQRKGFRMPWLELLLVGAGVALLFQFMPSWWDTLSQKAMAHAQVLLIALNVVVLVTLILWRQWKSL